MENPTNDSEQEIANQPNEDEGYIREDSPLFKDCNASTVAERVEICDRVQQQVLSENDCKHSASQQIGHKNENANDVGLQPSCDRCLELNDVRTCYYYLLTWIASFLTLCWNACQFWYSLVVILNF